MKRTSVSVLGSSKNTGLVIGLMKSSKHRSLGLSKPNPKIPRGTQFPGASQLDNEVETVVVPNKPVSSLGAVAVWIVVYSLKSEATTWFGLGPVRNVSTFVTQLSIKDRRRIDRRIGTTLQMLFLFGGQFGKKNKQDSWPSIMLKLVVGRRYHQDQPGKCRCGFYAPTSGTSSLIITNSETLRSLAKQSCMLA